MCPLANPAHSRHERDPPHAHQNPPRSTVLDRVPEARAKRALTALPEGGAGRNAHPAIRLGALGSDNIDSSIQSF